MFRIIDLDFPAEHFRPCLLIQIDDPAPLDTPQVPGQWIPQRRLDLESQQGRRPIIGIKDNSRIVQDDDALLQGVEHGFQQALGFDQTQKLCLQTGRVELIEPVNQFV